MKNTVEGQRNMDKKCIIQLYMTWIPIYMTSETSALISNKIKCSLLLFW